MDRWGVLGDGEISLEWEVLGRWGGAVGWVIGDGESGIGGWVIGRWEGTVGWVIGRWGVWDRSTQRVKTARSHLG